MANRMKVDDKNEKIIRGLLKQPANRRCINCNSLGPQYVCTNFWTFVCTTCSGIHREFTHRVKSVSMAKFSSQEVAALQAGGNECAKKIYFKLWDPLHHSLPESSNVDRLRDFIKHVYVDRRYTGERSIDRPPRVQNDREDSNDRRGEDGYRGGSRSPPYDDRYEHPCSEQSGPGGRNDDRNYRYTYDEERSPGCDQENQRYNDYRRSPARFEDDWRRDDRFGNGNHNRRFEDSRYPDGGLKSEGRSPNNQKDTNLASPPAVRPVRDILGEDVPHLRVGEPPKTNGSRPPNASPQTQRTASSSSMGSTDGNSAEVKHAITVSLIDFDADPEPPIVVSSAAPVTVPAVQQPTTGPSVDGGNWASFDSVPQEKVPQAPSSANSLDSALAQLSVPISASVSNVSTILTGGVQSVARTDDGGQWLATQQFAPTGGSTQNQLWNLSTTQNSQGPVGASSGIPSLSALKLPQEASSGAPMEMPPGEAKSGGRKELPVDLFTLTYAPAPGPVPGWQTGPHGMGFGIQYPTSVSVPNLPKLVSTSPQPSKSMNPFDLTNESTLPSASMFPLMASLQGELPKMGGPSATLYTSSLGTPSQQWVTPQALSYTPGLPSQAASHPSAMPRMPSYPSSLPLQAPSYRSTLPTGTPSNPLTAHSSAYMAHQTPNSMLTFGPPGIGGFNNEGVPNLSLGVDQQPTARHKQPATRTSHTSLGGNPFG